MEKASRNAWNAASGWLSLLSTARETNGNTKRQAAAVETVGSCFLNHWCASFEEC